MRRPNSLTATRLAARRVGSGSNPDANADSETERSLSTRLYRVLELRECRIYYDNQ